MVQLIQNIAKQLRQNKHTYRSCVTLQLSVWQPVLRHPVMDKLKTQLSGGGETTLGETSTPINCCYDYFNNIHDNQGSTSAPAMYKALF